MSWASLGKGVCVTKDSGKYKSHLIPSYAVELKWSAGLIMVYNCMSVAEIVGNPKTDMRFME